MVLVALIGISSLKGTIEAIEGFIGGAFSFSTEERTNSSELLFLGSMENFYSHCGACRFFGRSQN